MDKIKKQITQILNSLNSYIDMHKGIAELGEIEGNRVVIYCGGGCSACDSKCIEDAIREKLPHMEVIFR